MYKRLHIFIKLEVGKLLIYNYSKYNLYVIFAKFLDIYKQILGNLVNELGYMLRVDVIPRFYTHETDEFDISLEAIGVDRKFFLLSQL